MVLCCLLHLQVLLLLWVLLLDRLGLVDLLHLQDLMRLLLLCLWHQRVQLVLVVRVDLLHLYCL